MNDDNISFEIDCDDTSFETNLIKKTDTDNLSDNYELSFSDDISIEIDVNELIELDPSVYPLSTDKKNQQYHTHLDDDIEIEMESSIDEGDLGLNSSSLNPTKKSQEVLSHDFHQIEIPPVSKSNVNRNGTGISTDNDSMMRSTLSRVYDDQVETLYSDLYSERSESIHGESTKGFDEGKGSRLTSNSINLSNTNSNNINNNSNKIDNNLNNTHENITDGYSAILAAARSRLEGNKHNSIDNNINDFSSNPSINGLPINSQSNTKSDSTSKPNSISNLNSKHPNITNSTLTKVSNTSEATRLTTGISIGGRNINSNDRNKPSTQHSKSTNKSGKITGKTREKTVDVSSTFDSNTTVSSNVSKDLEDSITVQDNFHNNHSDIESADVDTGTCDIFPSSLLRSLPITVPSSADPLSPQFYPRSIVTRPHPLISSPSACCPSCCSASTCVYSHWYSTLCPGPAAVLGYKVKIRNVDDNNATGSQHTSNKNSDSDVISGVIPHDCLHDRKKTCSVVSSCSLHAEGVYSQLVEIVRFKKNLSKYIPSARHPAGFGSTIARFKIPHMKYDCGCMAELKDDEDDKGNKTLAKPKPNKQKEENQHSEDNSHNTLGSVKTLPSSKKPPTSKLSLLKANKQKVKMSHKCGNIHCRIHGHGRYVCDHYRQFIEAKSNNCHAHDTCTNKYCLQHNCPLPPAPPSLPCSFYGHNRGPMGIDEHNDYHPQHSSLKSGTGDFYTTTLKPLPIELTTRIDHVVKTYYSSSDNKIFFNYCSPEELLSSIKSYHPFIHRSTDSLHLLYHNTKYVSQYKANYENKSRKSTFDNDESQSLSSVLNGHDEPQSLTDVLDGVDLAEGSSAKVVDVIPLCMMEALCTMSASYKTNNPVTYTSLPNNKELVSGGSNHHISIGASTNKQESSSSSPVFGYGPLLANQLLDYLDRVTNTDSNFTQTDSTQANSKFQSPDSTTSSDKHNMNSSIMTLRELSTLPPTLMAATDASQLGKMLSNLPDPVLSPPRLSLPQLSLNNNSTYQFIYGQYDHPPHQYSDGFSRTPRRTTGSFLPLLSKNIFKQSIVDHQQMLDSLRPEPVIIPKHISRLRELNQYTRAMRVNDSHNDSQFSDIDDLDETTRVNTQLNSSTFENLNISEITPNLQGKPNDEVSKSMESVGSEEKTQHIDESEGYNLDTSISMIQPTPTLSLPLTELATLLQNHNLSHLISPFTERPTPDILRDLNTSLFSLLSSLSLTLSSPPSTNSLLYSTNTSLTLPPCDICNTEASVYCGPLNTKTKSVNESRGCRLHLCQADFDSLHKHPSMQSHSSSPAQPLSTHSYLWKPEVIVCVGVYILTRVGKGRGEVKRWFTENFPNLVSYIGLCVVQ